ncbi:amino acid/amide ABC transporter membrane protein 2 (HAAT family) [Rhizobium subbaraonis]|uniref:Amino acid/amide ABC transporter membrane protein 2 (HAAT family) n=1 Tax=Rhizobium subbaraonis TaxID=908946 RepID=A0A285UXH2_9HYPH|nr:branched-chain amino acid ABC transporter permease [Rhizobium subbaraonis]SOC46387.1 amino acid/amide ABC transporter membrane protein 2 (HAAT family) [Rhizobium subbaraonis]
MKHSYITAALLIGVIVALVVGTELLGIRLYDRIVTNLLISLVLVIGLQTFMGNSGLLSFAHIGFMGFGAYTSAVLTIPAQMKGMALPDLYGFMTGVEVSPLLAMLVAGIVAAIVAAIVSYPLMRLSDAAAVITSFALLVVLYTVMNNWSAFTNGPRTLFGLPKVTTMPMAAVVAALVVVVALVFKESRTGKLLRASREDEVAAAALGADIPKLRWKAFVLAAFIAGVGGALWGHFITSFAPKSFYLKETFLVITMLVIGGANTVTGAVAGAILVTFAYEGLRGLEGTLNATAAGAGQVVGLTEIVLAIAMIAFMVLRPGGLFPTREIGHILARMRRKKETSA